MTSATNGSINQGQMLADQEGSEEGDLDLRNVPEHIQRMPFFPPGEERLTPAKKCLRHEIW